MNHIIVKALTTPRKKFSVLKKEEYEYKLDYLSEELVKRLKDITAQNDYNQVNLLGIGNSIAGGWTAVDNNVNPLVNKLETFILPHSKKYNLNLDINSYVLVSKNSNKELYETICQQDITLEDIKNQFETSFDNWKKDFKSTPFENRVDKKIAMSYYSGGNKRFSENFSTDILTFSFLNANTGLIADKLESLMSHKDGNILTILSNKTRQEIITDEINYLIKIRDYILSQSNSSFLTIDNFPYISTNIGILLNHMINDINNEIEKVSQIDRTNYYDGIRLSFFQNNNNKIKLDNHPTIEEQYTSLVGYVDNLMTVIDNNPKQFKKK